MDVLKSWPVGGDKKALEAAMAPVDWSHAYLDWALSSPLFHGPSIRGFFNEKLRVLFGLGLLGVERSVIKEIPQPALNLVGGPSVDTAFAFPPSLVGWGGRTSAGRGSPRLSRSF